MPASAPASNEALRHRYQQKLAADQAALETNGKVAELEENMAPDIPPWQPSSFRCRKVIRQSSLPDPSPPVNTTGLARPPS
jgi:hypothetical protein